MITLVALAVTARVGFLGDGSAASDLSSLLGEGYEVRSFSNVDDLKAFHPSVVILGSSPDQAVSSEIDRYVPRLKQTLAKITGMEGHPKVLLGVQAGTSQFDRETLRPLTVQAARESGVSTVEAPDNSSIGFARELYGLVVDWKAVKVSWKVVSADSEQTDEGPAKFAIDGDPNTYWHTQYSPILKKYPHEIVVDMGESKRIGGFRCLPRQDGGANGRIKRYEFWVSLDGTSWGTPVSAGDLKDGMKVSSVSFPTSVQARYIKLVALTEHSRQPYASIAELDVLPSKFATDAK